jgi:hypothetical protein
MDDLPRLQLQLLDTSGAPLVVTSIAVRPGEDEDPETRVELNALGKPRATDELARMVERSLLAAVLEWHGLPTENEDMRAL